MLNTILENLNYVVGIVMILLPIPLLTGKIPMNHWYGIRIPKAYTSDENWRIINIYGAKVIIIWGILSVIIEFLSIYFFHISHLEKYTFPALFLLFAFIQILFFSRKIK